MRSMLFFKTKTPPNTQTQERGQLYLIHVQRYLAETYVYRQVERPRISQALAHLFMYTFFPPPSFLNVYRINSKRYYFNPQKQTSSP